MRRPWASARRTLVWDRSVSVADSRRAPGLVTGGDKRDQGLPLLCVTDHMDSALSPGSTRDGLHVLRGGAPTAPLVPAEP